MKVVQISTDGTRLFPPEELAQYGIEVVGWAASHDELAQRNGYGPVDAALVDVDGMGAGQRREAIARLTSQEICVVGMTTGEEPAVWRELMNEGAEGLVGPGSGATEVACTLWSAQRQFVARRALEQEVERLQQTLENRRVVEQAKSIIAELRGITEAEALRHLRREARNRRRSMHDLARVLIEARQILEPSLRGEGASARCAEDE